MTWPESFAELRKPFPPEQVGKIPASKGRPALDFVGHAAVTDRLNQHAPDWTYTVDELLTISGECWIRGTMTIGGVSRVEYGDGANPKEAIGNFIRRAAMRFGVAVDLWSREELQPAGAGSQRHPLSSPAPAVPVPQPESGETTAGMGADAGSAGGGIGSGKAATTPCPHTEVTGFKPDDTPLPAGFLRCLSCGKTFKDKA